MKTELRTGTLEKSPVLAEGSYTVDAANVHHITRILRDLYSNPEQAVVRELAANALDIHMRHGVTQPFLITLPVRDPDTRDWTPLVIRDFGPGLSEASAERLLFSYAASDKRDSNEAIGGFGIGCKSPFCLTDTFFYDSWNAGRHIQWRCYLDAFDHEKHDKIVDEPSTDPSGIQVTVPLPGANEHRVQRIVGAIGTLALFPLPVQVKYGTLLEALPRPVYEGPSGVLNLTIPEEPLPVSVAWRIITGVQWPATALAQAIRQAANDDLVLSAGDRSLNRVQLSLGHVPYKLRMAEALGEYADKFANLPYVSFLDSSQQLFFQLPVGFLPMNPSRETIQNKPIVHQRLFALVQAILGNTPTAHAIWKQKVLTVYDDMDKAKMPANTQALVTRYLLQQGVRAVMPKHTIDEAEACPTSIGEDLGRKDAARAKPDESLEFASLGLRGVEDSSRTCYLTVDPANLGVLNRMSGISRDALILERVLNVPFCQWVVPREGALKIAPAWQSRVVHPARTLPPLATGLTYVAEAIHHSGPERLLVVRMPNARELSRGKLGCVARLKLPNSSVRWESVLSTTSSRYHRHWQTELRDSDNSLALARQAVLLALGQLVPEWCVPTAPAFTMLFVNDGYALEC